MFYPMIKQHQFFASARNCPLQRLAGGPSPRLTIP
jgi:hypothetical protein